MPNFRHIMRDYGVFVVGIPSIIVIHLAWFRLQENELFVPKHQQENYPLIVKFNAAVKKIFPPFPRSEGPKDSE